MREKIEAKEAEQQELYEQYKHHMDECQRVFGLYQAVSQDLAELRAEEYLELTKRNRREV